MVAYSILNLVVGISWPVTLLGAAPALILANHFGWVPNYTQTALVAGILILSAQFLVAMIHVSKVHASMVHGMSSHSPFQAVPITSAICLFITGVSYA